MSISPGLFHVCCAVISNTSSAFSSKGVPEPLQTFTAVLYSPWVDMELLAPAHCASRCSERSGESVPAFEVASFRWMISKLSWKGGTKFCQALQ